MTSKTTRVPMCERLKSVTLIFLSSVVILSCLQASAQEALDIKYDSNNQPCVCVWYYLCSENDTLIQDGTGIIGARASVPTTPKPPEELCPVEQGRVCCRIPPNETLPTTARPTVEPRPRPRPTPTPTPQPQQPHPTGDTQNVPVALPVSIPKSGCGVKRIPVAPRVTSDVDDETFAQYAEFPWMLVVVTEQRHGVFRFECGASLIHPQVALTAAHCVKNLDHRKLKVRGGEWDTRSTNEPEPHQDRNVRRVKIHPMYAPGPLFNDIALLFLDAAFSTTENVDTICLPVQNAVFDGTRCFATGWGKDSFDAGGTYQRILRKVEVPVIPHHQCQESLRKTRLGPYFRLHDSFICAGGEAEKDTCKGDGGGPLVCPTRDAGRWTQVGIVSWGIDCGTENPAVYVNVPRYTEWILEEINNYRKI